MDVKSHVTRTLEILDIINNDLGFANVELRDTSIVSHLLIIDFRKTNKILNTFCDQGLFGNFS